MFQILFSKNFLTPKIIFVLNMYNTCGDYRDRTGDLLNANQVLSQLS